MWRVFSSLAHVALGMSIPQWALWGGDSFNSAHRRAGRDVIPFDLCLRWLLWRDAIFMSWVWERCSSFRLLLVARETGADSLTVTGKTWKSSRTPKILSKPPPQKNQIQYVFTNSVVFDNERPRGSRKRPLVRKGPMGTNPSQLTRN